MTRIGQQQLEGIFPAIICPLKKNHKINETELAAHISSLDQIPGIRGFLVNGHAGENYLLTRNEKREVLEIARNAVSDKAILLCGVNAESSTEAALHAHDVKAAGGDAIMIFPPNSWALSTTQDMIVAHHEAVIAATDLPIILYQAPVSTGPMAFSHDVLRALIAMPQVIAIKEGSWEVATYEANRRLVKSLAPSIAVMASGDEHLLTSFVLGSEGSIVSLAIIIPEIIVSLDEAVRRGDLEAAREAHNLIYPLAKAIYGKPPGNLATARLKTCLKILGRIESDAMRLPIGPLSENEVTGLREVLLQTGVLAAETKTNATA